MARIGAKGGDHMAQIPYGYKIEKGHIVADVEAAAKIGRFVECYLCGLSVKESKKAAEIPISTSSLNNLLRNKTYIGTDMYPPLITAEVFHIVQEERERRTHPATTKPSDPLPIKSRFVLVSSDDDGNAVITGAADVAAHLYSMIKPSADGRETATGTDINEIKRTSEKMIQRRHTWQ